jgi:hypothetical protein
MIRRLRKLAPAVLALGLGGLSWSVAQTTGFNEKAATARVNVQDKEDIWSLDLTFKGPRVIDADIPGVGKKKVWYLWYQIVNKTDRPRVYIPEFEVVTIDRNRNVSHLDRVMPAVQDQIARVEDPTGFLKIQNSVTISLRPVPPSKPNIPLPVTGVAIFPEIVDKSPDTTMFSIFVTGLSNGWTVEAGKLRRKTLQLNYRRIADANHQDSEAIKYIDQQWIYRDSSVAPIVLKPIDGAPAKDDGR